MSLLAEHGDKFVAALNTAAAALSGAERKALEPKIATLKKMIAFSRTVPNAWSEHDKLAKTTEGGMGIHAAMLDRDIGPLLQTQKLLDSVLFARMKGYTQPLTAAELELMNFTGDGNGFDLVTMPQELRDQVPTSNFFQRAATSATRSRAGPARSRRCSRRSRPRWTAPRRRRARRELAAAF